MDMEQSVAAQETQRTELRRVSVATFDEFYSQSHDRAYWAMVAVTRDPDRAADSLGMAYLRAFESWESVVRHPNPTAWLMRVAMNDATSVWRHLRRIVPLESVQGTASPDMKDPDLGAALARLSVRQRQVVALRYLVGLSGMETAEVLGIAEGTVGAHLSVAIATLRRDLIQE
jgi:RNA polymerase sigma factor (sigma-70 family)